MKSTKIMLVGLFSVAILGMATQGTEAATSVGSTTTDGTISFKDDTTGEIVDPNEPWKPLEPGEENGGGHTSGELRLQHVPEFKFGEQILKSGEQKFNPLVEKFYEIDPATGVADKSKPRYLPQFIQVTDMRSDDAQWRVKVKSGKFTAKGNHVLETTAITFTGQKMTNNIYTDVDARLSNSLTTGGLTLTDTEQPLFETMVGKNTKGSLSSLILNDTGVTPENPTETNSGVYIKKGKTDVPKKGEEYKAVITWSLEDGL